ncbi:hypothetical protein JI739_15335 [Ramlibacter sp. AW1]|uniref:Uncharacterized protein n=1 Tax=Ramlibacter aurantiacus TaxID=2801330 RepID=A0A937D4H3_9BURK|nr:hypothetical protein [Ramlibacter aurantiacus]MBL0421730.1 hypothetical protein [Ramlibacter aurantiacus]
MSSPTYKEPPLGRVYLGHSIVVALLGGLLPTGDSLSWLHSIVWPAAQLIPNAVLLTERAPDPIFAQTLIGISLWIAIGILAFHVAVMRKWGYHTKTFSRPSHKFFALCCWWAIVSLLLSIAWFLPLVEPISQGRAYYLIRSATSGPFGVATAMNQLLVSMPLFLVLLLWLGHACTTIRYLTQSN